MVTKARFARAVAAIFENRVSLEQAAHRYNCMRRLTPLQYSRLYRENCESDRSMNEPLDDLFAWTKEAVDSMNGIEE